MEAGRPGISLKVLKKRTPIQRVKPNKTYFRKEGKRDFKPC